MGLQMRTQVLAYGFHGLWLDRNDNHVGVLDGLRVIGKQFDAMLGGHFGPRLGTRIAGADLCCIQTFGQQAADQAGSHVAGADKGNTHFAHNRSL